MKDYAFDVKLTALVHAQADSLKEARNLVAAMSGLNLDVTEGPCRLTGGEMDDATGPCCAQIDGEDYDDDLISDDNEVEEDEEDEEDEYDDETEEDEGNEEDEDGLLDPPAGDED